MVTVSVDGSGSGSLAEPDDFDEVVSEDPVSAPDLSAGVTGESGASPPAVAFEVTDPSFAPGTPFHGFGDVSSCSIARRAADGFPVLGIATAVTPSLVRSLSVVGVQ